MDKRQGLDLKTMAYVLRRTNYGEADRILNLITPEGKISAMAKGVRRSKSKLAGGVEMFTRSEVILHFGRGELATLTGAKMLKFHQGILKELDRMELAGEILRKTERAAEGMESKEFFAVVDNALDGINSGMDTRLVSAWFFMNLARVMGEQINFYTDVNGDRLKANQKYVWDTNELALKCDENGTIDENGIKILRLMITANIKVVKRVRELEKYLPEISIISKVFEEVVK